MTYYYNHPLSFSEKRTSSSSPEQMQKRSFMADKKCHESFKLSLKKLCMSEFYLNTHTHTHTRTHTHIFSPRVVYNLFPKYQRGNYCSYPLYNSNNILFSRLCMYPLTRGYNHCHAIFVSTSNNIHI